MNTTTFKRLAAITFALLAAAHLSGCGSDSRNPVSPPTGGPGGSGDPGGGGGDGDGTPIGEIAIGVFLDAAVEGLSYTTTPSNVSSLTDSAGRFSYYPGDTVSFAIGDLVLGTVVAQEVVTPVTVAEALVANTGLDMETVAVNLLVLLQSLDVNGDPEDGITFTAEIRNAVSANSIDLTSAADAFTAALSNFVSNVSGASGVTLAAVDRDGAVEHFVGQSSKVVAGTYVRADADFNPITQKAVTLTMFQNGRYLLGGQHDDPACNLDDRTPVNGLVFSDSNGNGVESGRYAWNPLTRAFSVNTVLVETDGYCGFNEPVLDSENDINRLDVTEQGLVFSHEEGVAYRFVRSQPVADTFGGAWLQPNSLLGGQPLVVTFFPSQADGLSGRYLMVDGSLPNALEDTTPGVEEGCYSVDAQSNLTVDLNSTVCLDAIDTNSTAGVSHSGELNLFIDEHGRLLIVDGEEQTGFTRLPLKTLTHEDLAGTWIMETEPGRAPENEPGLFMLTIFDDGRFLFGTQHDDSSCDVPGYPFADQDPDGNGLEYGTLMLVGPGVVVPMVSVDTNGECGFLDANKGGLQPYFLIPAASGDAMVLWPYDLDEDTAGLLFKRAPSVADSVTGVWRYEPEPDQLAVAALLPGGVKFEVSALSGESGLSRESFTIDDDNFTFMAGGYEYCVDTQNVTSACLDDEVIVESYTLEGDTLILDGYTLTRMPGQ